MDITKEELLQSWKTLAKIRMSNTSQIDEHDKQILLDMLNMLEKLERGRS